MAKTRSDLSIPAIERFWAKVNKTDTCWLWDHYLTGVGYGQFVPVTKTRVLVHRWAYEQFVGPIPAGYQIDHLCRVRHCVNPAHLEAVTQAENLRRQQVHNPQRRDFCQYGHPREVMPWGKRECRTCSRRYGRESARRRREARKAA